MQPSKYGKSFEAIKERTRQEIVTKVGIVEMINWIYFPKSDAAPEIARQVVDVFRKVEKEIDSRQFELVSDQVLAKLVPDLVSFGFRAETGKKSHQKIRVPVLFGLNGSMEKAFEADAYNQEGRMVLEVEAGRAVVNNQFLKDLFQACMMHDVEYFGIAVRNFYKKSRDFERVVTFFETLYASNRLKLPLKGVMVIGY